MNKHLGYERSESKVGDNEFNAHTNKRLKVAMWNQNRNNEKILPFVLKVCLRDIKNYLTSWTQCKLNWYVNYGIP